MTDPASTRSSRFGGRTPPQPGLERTGSILPRALRTPNTDPRLEAIISALENGDDPAEAVRALGTPREAA